MEKERIKTPLKVVWNCPSNIAIVKYWGKKNHQIPCNSSLSLTLSNAFTTVELELRDKTTLKDVELTYYFENEINLQFEKRVLKFIVENRQFFPFIEEYALVIQSSNSFPHSTGIASSASAFGAICLALLDVDYQLNGKEIDKDFYRKASSLARMGSGSASRSIFPGFSIWGKNENVPHSSDFYAIELDEIHPVFQNMRDAILIVDDAPKKVSSSTGHALMKRHPYAKNRFPQANNRTVKLAEILKSGDIVAFVQICESEALTLHAMMMTSSDYYLLMKPNTIITIEKIINFRKEKHIPICFTLDAGPNVHLLYPEIYEDIVQEFIFNELKEIYKSVLFDKKGKGPRKIK